MDFTTGLNEMQKQAVLHTEGPLLILAGAGSGKTRVLTHRIAHLVENKRISPWSILAITFTNKAAGEMRERVGSLIGDEIASQMWVSTFHSMCVRILRRYSERLGYDRYFTIYDTADQKALLKDIIKNQNINEKNFPVGAVLGAISSKKNELITPALAKEQAGGEYRDKILAEIYGAYQKKLKENNAMDFDDLLMNTYELFKLNEDVLQDYQHKFRYILVDEYQDTNGVQYQLVQMLARKHQNLCVVGDDDQSIYGWRGADIRNILDFEKDFKEATVIKLEQNYRSTKNILDAANSVVAHNKGRKPKRLWTESEAGETISIVETDNEYREAEMIAAQIVRAIEEGEREYKDFAVLYRTNAQSRVVEEKFITSSIPYRLLGGTRFYERKEIKDLISYLKVISNPKDDVALKRIINVPKRGIGAASINAIAEYALVQNMDFFEAARLCKELGILGVGPSQKVLAFTNLIEELQEIANTNDIKMLLETLIEKTEYRNHIRFTEGDTAEDRLSNIDELFSKTVHYMASAQEPHLGEFLEEVALVADIDNYDEASNSVVLMTLHSAKGLEFPVVFMPGVEEGLFPSYMSMTEGEDKLEEERRLCYVGITRAREKLFILYANGRTVFGRPQSSMPSRFIKELPREVTNLAHLDKHILRDKQTGKATIGQEVGERRSFSVSEFTQLNQKRSFSSEAQDKSQKMSFQGRTIEKPTIPIHRKTAIPPFMNHKPVENLPEPIQNFTVGEVVKHIKFGQGTIKEVMQTDKDVFVTITFENGESRQLSTRFAKLQRLSY
ncbi:DNA helicase PcrA [Sporanaerobium hydrogeniformans]|uniref:DNA helicase PcrA n=1 Tax=Sporanaerobium hydrogeniformans TaxID=3072179 RepID=A0AC61DF75_9FIRM|nr:DNA helicase PcrA [Sporanaerobium hydrogeniformans]PHV71939.1 DNA helicase PcrA [Sporanaerobium hydrogeniformans]